MLSFQEIQHILMKRLPQAERGGIPDAAYAKQARTPVAGGEAVLIFVKKHS